ncbi:DUF3626 domain-containing protein [Rhodococcus kroppenstedtii]|uniref:DUF3626 domain-containing protein n=1 Tax=Rhodococcoides kroppenstedtii TaxID=293050 RepID=UPI001C9B3A32|nr:DUF3626 domain-containing protein [Rhodococcus kroppenstedtii]MBY6438523.1 DUF3626 domain-containing protein [Rhodococcus kroppenstedtii]
MGRTVQNYPSGQDARPPAGRVEAITVQFHPDWPHVDGRVIESIAAEGYYRSQFATGVSNGGLTALGLLHVQVTDSVTQPE